MRHELDEAYSRWREGKLSEKNLKQLLLKNAYQLVTRHFYQFSDDEIQELMLQFYLNLSELLSRYDSKRKSLSSFIFMFLSYQLSNIRSRTINKTVRSQIAACKDFHYSELPKGNESYAKEGRAFYSQNGEGDHSLDPIAEIPSPYGAVSLVEEHRWMLQEERKEESKDQREKWNRDDLLSRRKMLITLLKKVHSLTSTEQEQMCQLWGLNVDEIFHYSYLLSQLTKEKRKRKEHYGKIMNHHFNTLQLLRYRLFNCEDSYSKLIFKEKINRMELKLKNITLKYDKVKLEPSNRELSEVLGIPKGTIDSIFFQKGKEISLDRFSLVERGQAKQESYF